MSSPLERRPKPCGAPGPFFVNRPSKGTTTRMVCLSCSRPAGHHGNHQHAAWQGEPCCEWDRTGHPVRSAPDVEVY